MILQLPLRLNTCEKSSAPPFRFNVPAMAVLPDWVRLPPVLAFKVPFTVSAVHDRVSFSVTVCPDLMTTSSEAVGTTPPTQVVPKFQLLVAALSMVAANKLGKKLKSTVINDRAGFAITIEFITEFSILGLRIAIGQSSKGQDFLIALQFAS